MKKILLTVVLLAGLALMGPDCNQEPPTAAADDAIIAAVRQNVDAANAEDLEEYLATIDRESAYYDTTKEVVPRRFEKYDLDFKLDDVKVLAQTEDTAQVQFTMSVTKVKGPDFQNVKVTGIYLMQKRKSGWKISDVANQNFEPLPATP